MGNVNLSLVGGYTRAVWPGAGGCENGIGGERVHSSYSRGSMLEESMEKKTGPYTVVLARRGNVIGVRPEIGVARDRVQRKSRVGQTDDDGKRHGKEQGNELGGDY